jgi:hypothetical protein
MDNLLVAISNLPALSVIKRSFLYGDYYTTTVVSFVSSMSFVSHLIENHKHGMPGIGFSQKISYIFNRLDVLGAALTISRFVYLYYSKYGTNFDILIENSNFNILFVFAFFMLAVSEYDKYNKKLKSIYILTHSIWHISIFTLMDHFLSTMIY